MKGSYLLHSCNLVCEIERCQTDNLFLVACLVDQLIMVFLVWYEKIATLLKRENKLVQNQQQLELHVH